MQTHLRNSLLKEFPIETKGAKKMLSVYKGNLMEDDSTIFALSVYDHEKNEGQLYRSILKQDPFISSRERKILAGGSAGWVGSAPAMEGDKQLFFVHSYKEEGENFTITQLHDLLKLTFSAISAFLYEGSHEGAVALPVLFRKGIQPEGYKEFIHLFLYEAAKFLKRSPSAEALKIFIWNEEDAMLWENVVAAKTAVETKTAIDQANITELCREIQSKLSGSSLDNKLQDHVRGRLLRECRKTKIDIQPFTFAVYLLIKDVLEGIDLHGLPTDWKQLAPWRKVIILKSNRLLVEWLAEYMSSILTFNRMVKDQTLNPSLKDLYTYLLQVLQILEFYEETRGDEE